MIRSLDIQSPQINIAVKFIETTLKHNEIIGIDWDLRQKMDLTNNAESDTTVSFGGLLLGDQTIDSLNLEKAIKIIDERKQKIGIKKKKK